MPCNSQNSIWKETTMSTASSARFTPSVNVNVKLVVFPTSFLIGVHIFMKLWP